MCEKRNIQIMESFLGQEDGRFSVYKCVSFVGLEKMYK